ncbi:hypothetical protein G6F32_016112 [Rhizopus arrhizus]|nr:hypothetical protein G6F32_016112 [Rhizopus arrhizus]
MRKLPAQPAPLQRPPAPALRPALVRPPRSPRRSALPWRLWPSPAPPRRKARDGVVKQAYAQETPGSTGRQVG